MRIAMLAPINWPLPPSGYGPWEQVAYNLTEELVTLGHDVTLFAAGGTKSRAKVVETCPHALCTWPEPERSRKQHYDPASGLLEGPPDARVWEQRHIAACMERAAAGEFDGWLDAPESALALVILLDQFSRNMFRGQASRYDFDLKARGLAERSLDRGDAATLSPLRRCFLYMPFQHSEDLNDQARAVALFEGLASTPLYRQFVASAREHREIIRRFGRFPNRNEVLGRQTTAAEAEFLAASTCVHLKSA